MVPRARSRAEAAHARPRPLAALVLAVFLATTLAAGAGAQDLNAVKEQRHTLEQDIRRTTATLDELQVQIAVTRDELNSLQKRQRVLEAQARTANTALQDRARANFIRGEVANLESLLSSDGPQSALERARLLAALSHRDLASLENATALRVQLDQLGVLLTAKTRDLVALEARLDERAATLQGRFVQVSAIYRELKNRKDRQTRLSRGAQSGIYACIFQRPYHFRDTWGAPRSGGRSHKGTDVFTYYGAPVYAFTNGRIQRLAGGGLGGVGLYLWGDDGVQYYYAHLKGHAAGMYPGKRVEAGQLVAYNGDTGNADRSAPHVHFEVRPGGGGALNPYPWLTPVC